MARLPCAGGRAPRPLRSNREFTGYGSGSSAAANRQCPRLLRRGSRVPEARSRPVLTDRSPPSAIRGADNKVGTPMEV
jgi:hypothetical protein